MLLGVIVPLTQCPGQFAKNVLGYGSLWGAWGITNLIRVSGWHGFQTVSLRDLAPEQVWIMSVLKYTIIAAILVLAWRRRKVTGPAFFHSVTAAFAVFFALAPGAGVQYMVWFAPFLLLMSPRWWMVITAGSTCYLFAFYHSVSKFQFPWNLAFPDGTEVHYWAPWTNLPWIGFVVLVAVEWRRWYRVGGSAELVREDRTGVAGTSNIEAAGLIEPTGIVAG